MFRKVVLQWKNWKKIKKPYTFLNFYCIILFRKWIIYIVNKYYFTLVSKGPNPCRRWASQKAIQTNGFFYNLLFFNCLIISKISFTLKKYFSALVRGIQWVCLYIILSINVKRKLKNLFKNIKNCIVNIKNYWYTI